ncbi:37S ribosomal protein Rsm24 [Pleurostoma richardsiae]|uniref:37S ribosomal protein Rsm24 n=1 Tax=Pleurostoma richardsiae TaxID=41990 RepID=A0AA38S4Z8_9PEZI|nr:37S ribosomal protein Rsm24 [Pleurostoma richardsiae]
MASASQSLRLLCRSCRSQRPAQKLGPKVFVAWKSVSGGAIKEVRVQQTEKATVFDKKFQKYEEMEEKAGSQTPEQLMLSIAQELQEAHPELEGFDLKQEAAQELRSNPQWSDSLLRAKSQLHGELGPLARVPRVQKDSFWMDGEGDTDLLAEETPEDDEWHEDDITSMAHAKLEEHREHREYARIAIWEMPLLSKFAKPFEPPAKDEPLRFRYTSYMGEMHPAEKKVVVEFCPKDLDLTEVQRLKLKKLAGARYNPETDIVRMSCEMFEHQAQNKRYLGDLVDKLIVEAKDPKDTMEDIPLDTRHHEFKQKPKFPKEWRMTKARRKEIQEYRKQAYLLDEAKKAEGALLNGVEVLQKALAAPKPGTKEEIAELLTVPRKAARQRPLRS